jgi:hypothetical protein
MAVLGIAARGGLVVAVNEIQESREARLGRMWRAGFSRFWPLLGLLLVLQLPVLVISLLVLFSILGPLIVPLMRGGEPGAEMIAPLCGGFCLGLPIIIILSLLIDILHLIAVRYLMLGGQGVFQSIRSGWGFLRARTKDTVLMYLLSGALNLAAVIVISIPMVIVMVAAAVPAVMAAANENWSALAVPIVIAIFAVIVISLLYAGIWGTFTSALWTLFFRRAANMEPVAAVAPAPAPVQGEWPVAPAERPSAQAQPAPGAPVAPGPPVSGFGEPAAPPPPEHPSERPTPPVAPEEPAAEPREGDGV